MKLTAKVCGRLPGIFAEKLAEIMRAAAEAYALGNLIAVQGTVRTHETLRMLHAHV